MFVNELMRDLKKLFSSGIYVIFTLLAGVLSYGFEITHFSMGIDDISMHMYLDKGLLPETGRWVLFLINKVILLSAFNPFVTEVVGFIFLYIAAGIFCVLIMRISKGSVSIHALTVFAAIFISNPLFSEVDIYYLHNAADLGWILVGTALLVSFGSLEYICGNKGGKFSEAVKETLPGVITASLLLWIAAGCYESFMFVYISCMILILLVNGMMNSEKIRFKTVLSYGLFTFITCLAAFILRSIICGIIPPVFGLDDMTSDYVSYRSAGDAIRELFLSGDHELLKSIIRDEIVRYHINALVYLPIALYVAAMILILAVSLYCCIKHKSIWYILLWASLEAVPFLQSFVSGYLFPYRAAQFIPIVTAFGALVMYLCIRDLKRFSKAARVIYTVVFSVIIFNCCNRLNYNFYLDHMRYENDKRMLGEVTHDLYEAASVKYGDELCVYFAGHYRVPLAFRDGFYISVNDPKFAMMTALIKPIDAGLGSVNGHVSDGKYFYDHEMMFPLFLWGREAFNGTCDELVRFINMHGAGLTTIHSADEIRAANEHAYEMPCWPAEGSIELRDGYVLVRI